MMLYLQGLGSGGGGGIGEAPPKFHFCERRPAGDEANLLFGLTYTVMYVLFQEGNFVFGL